MTVETKRKVITPGGRVGDNASHNRSPKKNWVEEEGGLPEYIRTVRNALVKDGHSESRATALAIAAIKRWARGAGNVSAKVQAAAVKALAQWEAMKARAHAKGLFEYMEEKKFYSAEARKKAHTIPGTDSFPIENVQDLKNAIKAYGRAKDKAKAKAHIVAQAKRLKATHLLPSKWGEKYEAVSLLEVKEAVGDTILGELEALLESKDDDMQMETKSTQGVGGVHVLDEEKGIVETLVSVTGIKDNVNDIIHPGAYEKTLSHRTPKGVYAHDWKMPVSKALECKELMPGDGMLPKALPNDDPWPSGAGALYIKAQFNLDTQQGRDAFSNVKFYGDEQEWSIGYNVPLGGATQQKGIRNIEHLELYEFSPVLFGAMPAARTQTVKDILGAIQHEGLSIDQVEEMEFAEFKDLMEGLGVDLTDDDGWDAKAAPKAKADDEEDPDNEDDEDEDESTDEKAAAFFESFSEKAEADAFDFTAYEYEWLTAAYKAIGDAIDYADAEALGQEGKAYTWEGQEEEEKSLLALVEENSRQFGPFAKELKEAAENFDNAYDNDDDHALDIAGGAVLDVLEKMQASGDPKLITASHKVAYGVAEMAPDPALETVEGGDEGDGGQGAATGNADVEAKPSGLKKLPPRPGSEKQEVVELDLKDLSALNIRVS